MAYSRQKIESNDLSAAENCMLAARQSHPSDRQIILQLARILAWQKKFSDANALVADLTPVDSSLESLRGDLAWYQGNCQLAIDHYEAAAKLSLPLPLEDNAESNYVRCLWATGNRQGARSRVDFLLKRMPESKQYEALDQLLKHEASAVSKDDRIDVGFRLGAYQANQSQNQSERHHRIGALVRKAKVGSFATDLIRVVRDFGAESTTGNVLEISAAAILLSGSTTSLGYSTALQDTLPLRRSLSADHQFKAWDTGVLGLGVRYSLYEDSDALLITPGLEQYLSSVVLQTKLYWGISDPPARAIAAKIIYSAEIMRPFFMASGGHGEARRSYLIGANSAEYVSYGVGIQFIQGSGLEFSIAYERTLQKAFAQNALMLDVIWFR